ncbi:M60 family metallopeptidase [Clostridium botulinum]|uniref:M60 family metallopeptidase n=1 Tax=Clostridium botulinum TaxID=1491 RepID=UPI0019670B46|nr:M60 family metallopeptidase [Clostridium botulinum]MBN1057570.1 hypothetical protein [Clostridium botulinum]MBN1060815.1 hypothetical protein [Clostridium botulinum]
MNKKAICFLLATVLTTQFITSDFTPVLAATRDSNTTKDEKSNINLKGTLDVNIRLDVPFKRQFDEQCGGKPLNLLLENDEGNIVKLPLIDNQHNHSSKKEKVKNSKLEKSINLERSLLKTKNQNKPITDDTLTDPINGETVNDTFLENTAPEVNDNLSNSESHSPDAPENNDSVDNNTPNNSDDLINSNPADTDDTSNDNNKPSDSDNIETPDNNKPSDSDDIEIPDSDISSEDNISSTPEIPEDNITTDEVEAEEEIDLIEDVVETSTDDINYTVKSLDYFHNETSDDIYNYHVSINNLPLGKYSLKITGEGFAPITLKNKVNIKDYSQRVYIATDSKIPLIVDVDGDGESTKKDYELIEKNIDTLNSLYDLNRDGLVDISDLTICNESIKNKKDKDGLMDTSAIFDYSKVSVDAKKGSVSGDIENLFNGSDELLEISTDENGKAEVDLEVPEIETSFVSIDTKGITEGEIIVLGEGDKVLGSEEIISKARQVSTNEQIVINLGTQVAVKRIKIKISSADPTNSNLAQIGKVEFLNNIYAEAPIPDPNAPTIYSDSIIANSKEVRFKWTEMANVDGYEISYIAQSGKDNSEKIIKVGTNSIILKDLENFKEYNIKVRSYSGDSWYGDWSETISVTPAPTKAPDAPENINIKSEYKGLNISWKAMDGAEEYTLFYKKETDSEFTKIENIKSSSYYLNRLDEDTTYDIQLMSHNEFGASPLSKLHKGLTIGLEAPIIPNYKLLNTSNDSDITNHIVDVEYPGGYKEDEYPNGFNKFNVVDNDYSTYWQIADWDVAQYSKRGPIVTFDDNYEIDTIRLSARLDGNYNSFYYCNIKYWDEENKEHLVEGKISSKTGSNKKVYYEIKLSSPITANKVQVNLSNVSAGTNVTVSELKFYHYDSLETDVKNLFTDDMRIELKDDVTLEEITELENRANTLDDISKEYHPQRDNILYDLNTAKSILEDRNIAETITLDQNINNSRNSHLGFAMQLNDYQPLGISARAGDEISIYVGTDGNVMPEVIFTQYYPESSQWTTTVKSLTKGKNVIEVPKIGSMATERGGSVYVRYPRNSATNNEIKIRVSGGTKIPYLNLSNIVDEEISKKEIEKYITTLEEFNEKLPTYYEDANRLMFNKTRENKNLYKFDEKTSVLNSTEIVTDKFLLTLPATEVLRGINLDASTLSDKIDKVYDALLAWEELGDIAYGVKGLYENPDLNNDGKVDSSEIKHSMPSSRLNIRYTRMFSGAFMYASSGHIGIEFGSVAPLLNGKPYTKNSDNDITAYNYYGWGIAHEIGHVIDEGNAIYGETTNNIISLMAQTIDDKALSRLESSDLYPKIYEKVNSGSIGVASNVFVSLGMFWQLHLAYDNEASINQEDSFYAKLSRLYRENTESTPNVQAKDNLLIRLASDAAQKDLTEFFKRWGLIANNDTITYLASKGYEKENKAIYYMNDDARRKVLSGISQMSPNTKVIANLTYDDSSKSKEVNISLSTNNDNEKILGYEIYRNGKAVGFTTDNNFTDVISANNRVFNYEVIAYDYHLNKTSSIKLEPIRVSHDGSLAKGNWLLESNTNSLEDVNDENNPSGPVEKPSIDKVKDNNPSTIYTGKKADNSDPFIIVDLNSVEQVSGIKYSVGASEGSLPDGTINNYQVYVSKDKENWILASSGNFNLDVNNATKTIYFNQNDSTGGKQLWTYEASYVKLVAPKASSISIGEIDVIGNPGDNLELQTSGIGTLSSEYRFGNSPDDVIPKDSIIFTGNYRGNPGFNAILLKDENNNVLSGDQIFMAEIPDNGHLGEVSEGSWIFWISSDEYSEINALPSKIKGELYRVNDAETLEGQRLVSDTLYVQIQNELPNISLEGGIIPKNSKTFNSSSFEPKSN